MIASPQTHESQADKVLGCLRGYMYRQNFHAEDREIIAGILREWEEEVAYCESRIASLEKERDLLIADKLLISQSLIGRGFEFATHRNGAS